MSRVLVVDDKELMRDSVATILTRAGWSVQSAADGEGALRTIAEQKPDAILTDLQMPGMSGVDLLREIRRFDEELPVVFMTAYGTVESAIEAMRLGAYDYISKPFNGDRLIATMRRAIEHGQLVRENAVLHSQVEEPIHRVAQGDNSDDSDAMSSIMVGSSRVIHEMRSQIDRIAPSQSTVLICGESGTGKEVVAQLIHQQSERASKPMLAVNCAALSASLLESELFGHERGAFTGADKLRKGRFELADGGTLLLDEISEVPPEIQAKLLRVLQERAFERVGSSLSQCTDVRVIATTNRRLDEEVRAGRFREDLFYRLNVLPIHVPPLRDHREDVPALCEHFLAAVAESNGRKPKRFDEEAFRLLMNYHWPGNVRELGNVCERACLFTEGEVISADVVRPWLLTAPSVVGVESGGGADRRMSEHPTASAAAHVVRRHEDQNGQRATASIKHDPIASVSSTSTSVPTRERHAVDTGGPHEPFLANVKNGHHPGDDLRYSDDHGGESRFASSDANATDVMNGSTAHVAVHPGKSLEEIEREVIVATLNRNDGHRRRTARELGIGVRTLGLKLRKWKDLRLVAQDL